MSDPWAPLMEALEAFENDHGLSQFRGIVVGVSGGPDSVALLCALDRFVREHPGSKLVVGHLDHGLRPGSSADAAFVSQLGRELDWPVVVGAEDVAAMAGRLGIGLEAAGRRCRYALLAETARRHECDAVAVAHHADDEAETVLMNVIRGTGLEGLSGMAPTGPVPDSDSDSSGRGQQPPPAAGSSDSGDWAPRIDAAEPGELLLVRPFLSVSRNEILASLDAAQQPYRTDPSNIDTRFLRNRVREEILPAIEALNPRFREALLRLAEVVASDLAYLDQETQDAWERCVGSAAPTRVVFNAVPWDDLHPALQRRLIRAAAGRLGVDLRDMGLAHVDRVRDFADSGQTGDELALPGNLRVRKSYATFELVKSRTEIPPLGLGDAVRPLTIDGAPLELPGGWRLTATARARQPGDPIIDRWTAAVDAGRLQGLGVRGRTAGDTLQPLGMAGHSKSLQDLFTDARIPRQLRDGWPILVSNEEIVWVPGVRLDERYRLRPGTRDVVEIRAEPPEGVARGGW